MEITDELIAISGALNIPTEELSKPFSIWRFTTLNIRGVDLLTSDDIFAYFGPIHPHSIEWLSNISCNVTFDSRAQACNAIQSIATGLIIHRMDAGADSIASTIPGSENIPIDLTVRWSDQLDIPVPPNYRYILGSEHEKAKAIIVRFATINDKKITSTAGPEKPPGISADRPLYKPPSAALRDRNVFRRTGQPTVPAPRSQPEAHVHRRFSAARVNVPRMRMRADEEEQEQRKTGRRSFPPAASKSITSRLGRVPSGRIYVTEDDVDPRSTYIPPRFRLGPTGSRYGRPPPASASSAIVKTKNHIWRRSFGGAGRLTSRNDLRETLAAKNAMVRVRVSYDDDEEMMVG